MILNQPVAIILRFHTKWQFSEPAVSNSLKLTMYALRGMTRAISAVAELVLLALLRYNCFEVLHNEVLPLHLTFVNKIS